MSLPDFMLAPGAERIDEASLARVVSEDAPAAAANDAPRREAPPFVPGVFRDMPAEKYHAIEALSQSGAKEMLRSPMHYRYFRDHPREPTAAMRFGTAVHEGVLEPDTFEQRVVALPDVNARTNAGKAELAAFMAQHAGKLLLSADDFDRARRCVEAVHRHPSARMLLAGGERETSLFWRDRQFDVPCKARIDLRNLGGLVDLKTTADASADEFAKSVANFGYALQAANYYAGCEELLDATPEFFALIAVESEAPHGVACYALGSDAFGVGRVRMDEAMRRYREALTSGYWSGYPPTIDHLTLPRWATRVDFYRSATA